MSRRVLVVGAAGRLGAAMIEAFADATVVAHTRESLDVTDGNAVRRAVVDAAPDVIVNCAAYNLVDAAEDHPVEALAVNAFAVRALARAADETGATLFHYGTDFVFDGTARVPYTEDAAPAPRSAYALSKLLGEWFALDARRGFVLRVESLFGQAAAWSGRRGTLDTMVDGLLAGREVTVFTDRIVSPSHVGDIAAATRFLVEHAVTPGLYHCVNTGAATWRDVAREAARRLGVEPRLKAVTMGEVQLRAARPLYCAMDNGKLARAGFPMPTWQDALGRWLAGRQSKAT
jgi:dTDP-4-dehydrorhamnose reductase